MSATPNTKNVWQRLSPMARVLILGVGVPLAMVLMSLIGAEDRAQAGSADRVNAAYAQALNDSQRSKAQAMAPAETDVTIEQAYADLEEAGIGTLDQFWRRSQAERYIAMRADAVVTKDLAIAALQAQERDELAHSALSKG